MLRLVVVEFVGRGSAEEETSQALLVMWTETGASVQGCALRGFLIFGLVTCHWTLPYFAY